MSAELYYTSAERGLKPHSRGFCTVARTEGMPPVVVERLESLSSYQPVFPAGSSRVDQNPIAWSHWRVPVASRTRSVLSRVAFVGSDYTGRPSSFAHHVLLEPAEQLPAGPIAMLTMAGVMETSWSGAPMMLPPRVLPEAIETTKTPAPSAFASKLAEAFRSEPDKPAYVIYEPGYNLLPTLNEAVNLLPPALRWQVTFTTYFTELPAGLSCAWRCVVADTAAAATASRVAKGLVIDLARQPGGV